MKKAVPAKKYFPDIKNYTAQAGIMFTEAGNMKDLVRQKYAKN